MRQVLQNVLETERSGVEVPWSSSVTGNAGMVMVERTYFRSPEQPCRDYMRTIVAPTGDKMTIRGTGCRVGAENWTLEEQPPETKVAKKTPGKPDKAPKIAAPPDEPDPPEDKVADETAKVAPPEPDSEKPEKQASVVKAPPPLEYRLPTRSDI